MNMNQYQAGHVIQVGNIVETTEGGRTFYVTTVRDDGRVCGNGIDPKGVVDENHYFGGFDPHNLRVSRNGAMATATTATLV